MPPSRHNSRQSTIRSEHRSSPRLHRFDAHPPNCHAQILPRILTSNRMHTAVQHLFTGRSDLRFLASSYHHTEIIREVIERIRVDSPSLATTLQPLATSNDSFRVTVIKQMIDLGAVRRLGSLNIAHLTDVTPSIPHRSTSSSEDDNSQAPCDPLAEAERGIRQARRQIAVITCYRCDEIGHSPRQCPRMRPLLRVPTASPSSHDSPPPLTTLPSESPKPIAQDLPTHPRRAPTPNPSSSRTVIDLRTPEKIDVCYNCREPGHIDVDCPYSSLPSSPDTREYIKRFKGYKSRVSEGHYQWELHPDMEAHAAYLEEVEMAKEHDQVMAPAPEDA